MSTVKVSKPTNLRGWMDGRAKWFLPGALALLIIIIIAVLTGYAGFGWAHLMAAMFPRDEALLEYVPGDTASVVILDPHQLDPKALGADDCILRTYLTRNRTEIKKATGIDLGFDVDKLALTPALVVARGRFDAKKLAKELSEARYTAAEHKGHPYLVRAGEDAIAVIGDSILLYADEAGIKAAIDARDAGASLAKNEEVTARLKRIGWDHALLIAARIADDRPSIRAILTGSTGPRAVTVAVSTKSGLDLDAMVESASPTAADELRKRLDEKRTSVDELTPAVGPAAAEILVDIAKNTTITSDPAQSFVKIRGHIEPAQLDALIKAASSSASVGEFYKSMRLYQLLVPGM
jgi:hypothetical protein